jgi:hypothetical protein
MDSILDFAKGAITTTPISRVSHLEMDTKSGREIHRLIKTLIVDTYRNINANHRTHAGTIDLKKLVFHSRVQMTAIIFPRMNAPYSHLGATMITTRRRAFLTITTMTTITTLMMTTTE